MEQGYRRLVNSAGHGELLVQRAIRRPDHCQFTDIEREQAWDDLARWVESGVKPAGDNLLSPNCAQLGSSGPSHCSPGIPVGSDDGLSAGGVEIDPDDAIAPYYDASMGDFLDDLSLYMGFAERVGGRVLELGCGTGRLLLPLAKAEAQVVGIDRSARMLSRARSRIRECNTASLVQAGMAQLPFLGRFSLVFASVDTFLHLLSTEEQQACLCAASAALEDNGLLLLDLLRAARRRPTGAIGRPARVRWFPSGV